MKHSRKDIKLFRLRKAAYLEEDIFKYFYPFCLLNCTLGSLFVFRGAGLGWVAFAGVATLQYVYILFAFPVEAWHFHRRAISTSRLNQEGTYAQWMRDSYIQRFPDTWKAKVYRDINESEGKYYSNKLANL